MPVSSKMAWTRRAMSGCCSCCMDRFTPTRTGGKPAVCQRTLSSHAVRKIHSPREMIRPVCSATGMNSLGGTLPRTLSVQRASASTPTIRPERRSTCGW